LEKSVATGSGGGDKQGNLHMRDRLRKGLTVQQQALRGDDIDHDMKAAIQSMCLKPEDMANISWDNVIGLEDTKKLLQRAISLPREIPHVFQGMRRPPRSILLYGPPGVGKSHIIKALAKECNCTFFNISSSKLVSKYLGESGKMITAMFSVAKESKPCIIFIDEIDALCGDRDSGQQHGESSKALNVLLEHLSGMNDHHLFDILFIGATNLPEKIDNAMMRRFSRKIYIPLPNEADRLALFKYMTSQNKDDYGAPIPDDKLKQLAADTDLYSCNDIENLVVAAYEKSLILLDETAHFGTRRVSTTNNNNNKPDVVIVPCNETDPGAHPISFRAIGKDKHGHIRLPAITYEDIVDAKKYIKPNANVEKILHYEKWTKKYGGGGDPSPGQKTQHV
jgi:vacuolar protein-sorting-associated protein 4